MSNMVSPVAGKRDFDAFVDFAYRDQRRAIPTGCRRCAPKWSSC